MNAIYTLYWPIFQKVFLFISLGISLNLFLSIKLNNAQLKMMSLISWLSSLALLLGMYFATFFAGILYDELQIPTDNLLLFSALYVTIVFGLQTIISIIKNYRYRKSSY